MGFRTGSYATVWSVEAKTDHWTKIRISTSKKNKDTGEYETDFSGFVDCRGTAVATKAAALKAMDRIKLGDVEVTNSYDKEKDVGFTNYKLFSFEKADSNTQAEAPTPSTQRTSNKKTVDDGEVEPVEDNLPF